MFYTILQIECVTFSFVCKHVAIIYMNKSGNMIAKLSLIYDCYSISKYTDNIKEMEQCEHESET